VSDQIHGKRRAPRYYLGGVVELTDLDSGRMKVALVRALSLYGCLVKTDTPFKEAARVALKIAPSGTHFSAIGRVVDCVRDQNSRVSELSSLRLIPSIRYALKLALLSWRQPRNYRLFLIRECLLNVTHIIATSLD
jgi:hypothetical protein